MIRPSQTPHRQADAGGFTLVELLVVIGIISVLIAILLPSLARARESAIVVKCQSNVRQIVTSMHLYAVEQRNYLPAGHALDNQRAHINGLGWIQRLVEGGYMQTSEDANSSRRDVFICPADDLTRLADNGSIAWGARYNTTYKGLLFYGWYDKPDPAGTLRNLPMKIHDLPYDDGKYGVRRGQQVPLLVEGATVAESQFGLTVPFSNAFFRENVIEESTPHRDAKRSVAYSDGSVLFGKVVFKLDDQNREMFYHPQRPE
ncbi:MAG: type II secretion system protein [Planctomycetota bacterium]